MAGISVAFTSPAGISAEASGPASPDGTPLTPDSMLQAGSVSKAVTAYAAHRLAPGGPIARGEPVPGLLETLAGTAGASPVALAALPGLTWAYSGGGYLVVAQVICDVTGLAFAEAMAELVLDPAGMTASTFRQPLPGSLEPAAAWGHHGGEPVPGGWRNQPDAGAVGLWTTPSDLVRFAVAVSAERSVQMTPRLRT